MPIYNFTCPECGHEQGEKIVKRFDSEVLCPKCKYPMAKNISSCNFIVPYSNGDWQNG